MADVLFIRPSYDTITSTLHQWADDVVSALQGSGAHNCRELSGARATRVNTDTQLQQPTDCVVFYGHGDNGHLFSQHGPAALDQANDHRLARKLVYVVACDSAQSLGQDAVSKGAKAYIGYNDLFGIVWGGPETWFRRAANACILWMIAPPPNVVPSCAAAVNFAKSTYDHAIHYYSRGGGVGHYNHALAAAWLRWNRDSLVRIGDGNALL